MSLTVEPPKAEILKRTTSRCPICHVACPAEVRREPGNPSRVFLDRTCVEHGLFSQCIASDARFYWLARGKESNSCCSGSKTNFAALPAFRANDLAPAGTLGRNAPGRGEGPFETLATCLALIEIVHSCNLACPTCYADSPIGKVDAVPLNELKQRIDAVIDRKGPIEILQLSGGEPTLHPQFFELLDWVQEHPKIDYVLINTNGVRIASDAAFAQNLAPRAARRHIQLYLQFDGIHAQGQQSLRGGDLRAMREKAIERCREIGLPITLAMTVTPENVFGLWDAIDFGLKFPHVRGIAFQPVFQSGRAPKNPPTDRLNTADIILAAVEQSSDKLRFDDFTPLPCGDPNCATIGYLLKLGGEVRSVSDFIDFTSVQGFLRDKVRYRLEDLIRCGCESQPLAELLKQFELDESHTFRLLIKPFMDAWTWDEDRIDRCCTHVIRPDGKLDSFCRYYSGFADLQPAP
jgi:7,8-dihydro-6-hydroxymethylpterin dimethyltransferase